MENAALGLAGLALGVLITWLAMRIRRSFVELEGRVSELENRRRHTHRTIAGIEDATALVIDLEIEAAAMQARLDTVRRILGKTREGPESYENCEFKVRPSQEHLG